MTTLITFSVKVHHYILTIAIENLLPLALSIFIPLLKQVENSEPLEDFSDENGHAKQKNIMGYATLAHCKRQTTSMRSKSAASQHYTVFGLTTVQYSNTI